MYRIFGQRVSAVFFITGGARTPPLKRLMHGTYQPFLVCLSIAVAVLASYTVLELADHCSTAADVRWRTRWLAGGALVLGAGIWAMHFIGMLAFSLPIELGYDFKLTAISLLIAIVGAYLALRVVMLDALTVPKLLSGGLLLGASAATMHYTGMAALKMDPDLNYRPLWFAASVMIAVGGATVALWLTHRFTYRRAAQSTSGFDGTSRGQVAKRGAAACVMGAAVAGMHYTAMAAASFGVDAICRAAAGVSINWLAFAVSCVVFALFVIALVVSLLTRFVERQKQAYARSLDALNDQLIRLATLDPLTELPNRTTLAARLENAIERCSFEQQIFAVLFMDLDGFKTINDSLGHAVGDSLLQAYARRLLTLVPPHDMVARIGGDEFVIVLEHLASPDEVIKIADNILHKMQEHLVVDNAPMHVTPSMGIALYPRDGESVGELLKNADAAMYTAKEAGRNTYRMFESYMNESARRAMEIQRGLYDAIENHELRLHFQPKFSGLARELVGAEALIRWEHPQMGLVSPAHFIPVAERSGQIIAIGYWVVAEVCRNIKEWEACGLPAVKVAINLSPQQLRHSDLAGNINAAVAAAGVSNSQIMFEITETVAMENAEKTSEIIRDFHAFGFEIAIDDFGTGYSSLAYLQNFRVKQLKIDRFFTNGLDISGDEGYSIVSAIIALAHSLNMDVVAEGVETFTQLTKLNELHCDQVQGFFLSKPLAANDFQIFLDRSDTRMAV